MMKILSVLGFGLFSWIAFAAPCDAALLTYRMTLVNESPLTEAGEVIGFFSFDDSLAPDPGTNFLASPDVLTELAMAFDGLPYDTNNTNSSGMRFDDFDRPESTSFGTDCDPPSCSLQIGTVGWIISIGFDQGIVNGGLFQYTDPSISGTAFVTIELTRVPLPPGVLLLASGLASVLGASVRLRWTR